MSGIEHSSPGTTKFLAVSASEIGGQRQAFVRVPRWDPLRSWSGPAGYVPGSLRNAGAGGRRVQRCQVEGDNNGEP